MQRNHSAVKHSPVVSAHVYSFVNVIKGLSVNDFASSILEFTVLCLDVGTWVAVN